MSLLHNLRKKFFLNVMSSIQVGSLRMTLPNGEILNYMGKIPGRHTDIIIKNEEAYGKILQSSDIGLAEAYRDNMVDSTNMTELLLLCIENHKALDNMFKGTFFGMTYYRFRHLLRRNSRKGSKQNIEAHYDLGNSFYKLWLDPTMTYSSALFKHEHESLESAQINKYQRIIDTLNIKSSDHILEIGCGWGGFATLVAKQTGCKVTCLTLSQEQHCHATSLVKQMNLEDQVTIKICDYRDETGIYDHIVSIEMIEAVGENYWGAYFQTLTDRLKQGGKAMIQSIYILDEFFENYRRSTDFIQQYIFPGGMLLAPKVFTDYAQRYQLKVNDFFSFGPDYARTLYLWREQFLAKLSEVGRIGFDPDFLKLWDFYYVYCEAGFRSRRIDVAQIVFEKK